METNGKLLLSVEDVIAATGIGRSNVFKLFKTGELKIVKVGRRTFVRPSDLHAFVARCAERATAA